jgi:hypothetical protein
MLCFAPSAALLVARNKLSESLDAIETAEIEPFCRARNPEPGQFFMIYSSAGIGAHQSRMAHYDNSGKTNSHHKA